MSEYQYYEFQAIDRPLTEAEMRELRGISSRAEITPTRFVNVYNWGDFRGDPARLMERYFDAFLYLANWGTHELMLRLPRHLLAPETAERYCAGESAWVRVAGNFVVLGFHSDCEDGDWENDGSGWLSSLVPLRADLGSGDPRALYLGWLLRVQGGELEEDETEPPVPPGLRTPNASLKAFADFLRVDEDLAAVAAEASPDQQEAPAGEDLERWVAALPETEKTRLLLRAVSGEGPMVRMELLRLFRDAHRWADEPGAALRTAGALLAAAEAHAEERRRRAAENAARDRARRDRELAAERERRLDELAEREGEAWARVDALIETKLPKAYDEAVSLLADLRDLAVRSGRADEAEARIGALRERHAKKRTLLQRLAKVSPGTPELP
jgi:hypothetical protein